MISREQLSSLQAWCQANPVRLCVLFGSQVTGETHSGSDVDLAIRPSILLDASQKLAWVTTLQTLLQSDVSLVLISPALDPILGFEIVKNGRMVFEQESGLWAKERARLWHAYNDALPFRRRARQQLLDFVQEARDGA